MEGNQTASLDRAYGAVLGACVGDAAGATLEFLGRTPRVSEVKNAMLMSGGGHHKLASGQITDDGELTIALMRGLLNSPPNTYSLECVARSYGAWATSTPFDMGVTTGASIGCVAKGERNAKFKEEILDKKGYAFAMQDAARFDCAHTSKANGSLMRATPIGVFGHRLTDLELAEIARLDCSLSHPNTSVSAAVAAYSIAIAELVSKPSATGKSAFERAKAWAAKHAPEEVRTWLHEAETNVICPFYPHVGFIKIGFTHAFRHLLLGTSYEGAIAETIAGGGDSDTNACIVGGLVGAAFGASSIPDVMSVPVLTCDVSKGRPRPDLFRPLNLAHMVKDLLAAGSVLTPGRTMPLPKADVH